jgi:hypothetical protein
VGAAGLDYNAKQVNCVRLRYDLTKRLQAEVETEDVQAGSTAYSIIEERPTDPLSGACVTGRWFLLTRPPRRPHHQLIRLRSRA